MILVSLFILANLVPQNVIAVTIATCEDADPGACEDMGIKNPNMCQETILSTQVCPKHCNKCPLVCYSGETSIDPTTNLIDFRQSNTVSCNAGQICKLSPHGTVLGSYMAECGDQQQCTNADICCNSNLCNTPKALTTLPPPTTTPKPTTTTVKQAFKCHPNDGQYRTVRLSDGELFTYRFGTSRLTADMAQADCERSGGSLADISTVQKLDFVSQVMGCANIGIPPYFIGGRRDNTLTWRWSDGDPIAMNSTYWQPGFPNTNNEDCMFIRVNPTRSFDDYECGRPLPYFLCEKKILPTAISCSTDDAQYHTVQLSDGDAFTYRIVHTMMTADLAEADCEKNGGSLAKLSTVPKLDIASQLIDCSKQNPLYGYFVDGRKENVTQPWKWSDGEVIPMNSTFWYPIFPNSQDEDCVIIRKIGLPSRSFDDIKCGYSQPYICERKVFHAAFLCHPDDGQYRTVRLPDGDLFTYRFVHTPMTAKMAQEDCVNTGGSLVKVSTVSKKDFIHQIMNCPGFEQRFHYVDGSNNYADLTWKWSDGQKIPMNNTFWISKYPDAPNVDHCLIISRNEWTFDDINCRTILPFICEKPSV